MSLENRVQKALVLESPKTPFVLKTVPIPKPGPGEVLVKISASGLNPVDWFIQSRDLFAPNTSYPAIIGLDMAGDVEEVGEGVKEISKGDRVNMTHMFSTAVYGLLPAHPVGMGLNPTFDDTVTYPKEVALVIGGSTSVGQYAIQILKSLGATHFIDRNEISFADLPAALPKVCSQPIKIIYTAVTSPEAQNAAYACLADDGKLAIATPRLVSWGDAEITTKKVYGVFGGPHIPPNREFGITLWKHLPRLLERGVFVPNRIEEIPNGLSGIVDGVKKYEKGEVNGVKLIVYPQDTPA